MKRVGGFYAHPVCLLFHPGFVVESFMNLKFMEVDFPKGVKKLQCENCGKANSTVIKCRSKGKCEKGSHIYCSLKNYDAPQGKGWRMLDQPLPSNLDFMDSVENLLYRAVRAKNTLLASQMKVTKGFKVRPVDYLLFCPEHSQTIVDCKCELWQDEKGSWVFC